MTALPLTTLATVLTILVLAGFGTMVSRARYRHNVIAPAVTGHPVFERWYRVQMNTTEQIIMLLPLMWLTSAWLGDKWGALSGLVWCLGRLVYARAYARDPENRAIGFYIGAVPVGVMFVAVIVAVILNWVRA